ncbi:MAG: glycosyltransferase family 4 protein [Draconibacterium sp.]|nr:glycosyltransferase family 4 protein [Draconibacterium sp.]
MKKKILFIYTNYSTFVKTDFEILASEHEVTKYQYKPVKGFAGNFIELAREFIFLLFNTRRFDAVFIWFADYHSFLPVLFSKLVGKKSFLVIGGYDVVKMPKLNYGVFTSKFRGFCAIFSMKNSTLNLAVSKNVERKVRWIAPGSNVKLVYNCVNISDLKETNPTKENFILTVAFIDSERTFYIKGIDTFIEVARHLPEFKFMIIGMSKNLPEYLLKNIPTNIEYFERVNHEELQNYYKRAKIYCQFSRSESFGVSIVEAMYFGCFPIVTNVGGMPELVGENGKIVNRNPETISQIISELQNNGQNRLDAMCRINNLFQVEQRKSSLLKILKD